MDEEIIQGTSDPDRSAREIAARHIKGPVEIGCQLIDCHNQANQVRIEDGTMKRLERAPPRVGEVGLQYGSQPKTRRKVW
jgi:hypothetical protein